MLNTVKVTSDDWCIFMQRVDTRVGCHQLYWWLIGDAIEKRYFGNWLSFGLCTNKQLFLLFARVHPAVLDSIAVSLFGNVTVDTEEILINTKIVRTKGPNNHSGTETRTLSRLCRLRRRGRESLNRMFIFCPPSLLGTTCATCTKFSINNLSKSNGRNGITSQTIKYNENVHLVPHVMYNMSHLPHRSMSTFLPNRAPPNLLPSHFAYCVLVICQIASKSIVGHEINMVSDCETVFWKFNPSNQVTKCQAKLWAFVLKTSNIVIEILSIPIWMSLFQAF